MSHQSIVDFGIKHRDLFRGKTVLEIGSYDINGGLRETIAPLAKRYVGIDIEEGPGVDQVLLPTADLTSIFGGRYDAVICTEVLEHAHDWRTMVHHIKAIPTELILVTTRSPGFPYHAFPDDYWRYTVEDFQYLFADMDIIELTTDPEYDGVFLLARKGKDFKELDLSNYEVHAAPDDPRPQDRGKS
jgi:hypothetical protein